MTILIEHADLICEREILPEHWLLIRDGRIEAFGAGTPPAVQGIRLDARGYSVAPGFVDLHVHGGGGADFGDRDAGGFLAALRVHLRGGTTTLLPTLMSTSKEAILESSRIYDDIAAHWAAHAHIPHLAGLHLEGPYFSPAQLGAQDAAFVRDPDEKEYSEILERCPHIRRWSAACERPGALAFGRAVRARGILPCIGHSDATAAQVRQAAANGYGCVTHLYSSCSMVHRNGPFREGGIVEAAFLLDELDVEMIGDGIHLPPDFLKLIYKIKGPEHIALITDCIRPGARGVPNGTWDFSDREHRRPVLIRDGVAIMPDETCFAGSIATMGRVVQATARQAGLPLCDVVRMASLTPARMLGLEREIGSIAPGKRADLVLLDTELRVAKVLLSHGGVTEILSVF